MVDVGTPTLLKQKHKQFHIIFLQRTKTASVLILIWHLKRKKYILRLKEKKIFLRGVLIPAESQILRMNLLKKKFYRLPARSVFKKMNVETDVDFGLSYVHH